MPSEAMIAALAPMMHGVAGARWQTERQLHLTLRFVGDVSRRTADDLAVALPMRALSLPLIVLSGVGFFESSRHPNALWVRATPRDPLAQLHRKFDRACQATGLEPEGRAYLPHITVARLPRSAGPVDGWIQGNAGFATEPLPFARCSLVESILTEAGSHYEELASVPVG
jgi:2'-5' RNA ligase